MTILLLNTAGPESWIALARDGVVLAERTVPSDRTLGRTLLVAIDEVLAANDLSLAKLDRIAAHIGPGGYSSVRTGATIATALAHAATLDLIPLRGGTKKELLGEAVKNKPCASLKLTYSSPAA